LQDLPAAVVSRVKHFFVDYLGIALRASSLDSSKPVRALARELMIPGQATLLGLGTTGADWAALANGMAAHSMELDDTFLEGSIHNESFLYAAAMALAEECGLSGRDFIPAIVAGGHKWAASCVLGTLNRNVPRVSLLTGSRMNLAYRPRDALLSVYFARGLIAATFCPI
jgi:2-methylcitrate dehydratase PrpD